MFIDSDNSSRRTAARMLGNDSSSGLSKQNRTVFASGRNAQGGKYRKLLGGLALAHYTECLDLEYYKFVAIS